MSRAIRVTSRAQLQVYQNLAWWAEHHSVDQALRWLEEFEGIKKTLATSAERFPLADEAALTGRQMRQLNFGIGSRPTHRVLFSLDAQTVFIHGVYHASQRPLRLEDFNWPTE